MTGHSHGIKCIGNHLTSIVPPRRKLTDWLMVYEFLLGWVGKLILEESRRNSGNHSSVKPRGSLSQYRRSEVLKKGFKKSFMGMIIFRKRKGAIKNSNKNYKNFWPAKMAFIFKHREFSQGYSHFKNETLIILAEAPKNAKNISHWVSQGSPWVPRKASAASPVARAVHHSKNS